MLVVVEVAAVDGAGVLSLELVELVLESGFGEVIVSGGPGGCLWALLVGASATIWRALGQDSESEMWNLTAKRREHTALRSGMLLGFDEKL